jgi:hypothetical protein
LLAAVATHSVCSAADESVLVPLLQRSTVVYLYLLPRFMAFLLPYLKRYLRPGARIVSYTFSLPGEEPDAIEPVESPVQRLLLYRVAAPSQGPASVSSEADATTPGVSAASAQPRAAPDAACAASPAASERG